MSVSIGRSERLGALVWCCSVDIILGAYGRRTEMFTGLTAAGAQRKAQRWVRRHGLSSVVVSGGAR